MLEKRKKTTIGAITVELNMKVRFSLWSAFKLRLAGKNAEPVIQEIVRAMRTEEIGPSMNERLRMRKDG